MINHFSSKEPKFKMEYILVFLFITSILLFLIYHFRYKIFNLSIENKVQALNNGFGYYSDPTFTECITEGEKCNVLGIKKEIRK